MDGGVVTPPEILIDPCPFVDVGLRYPAWINALLGSGEPLA
jgi:hypothetical protein